MVMIRPKGKASKIAQQVLKNKGVKVVTGDKMQKTKPGTPFLQHNRVKGNKWVRIEKKSQRGLNKEAWRR